MANNNRFNSIQDSNMDLEPSILTLDESILRNLFNFDPFEDLSFHMDGQMVEGLGHSWQDVGSNLDLFNLDLDLHGFNEIENPMERMIQYVPGSIPSPSPINGDQSVITSPPEKKKRRMPRQQSVLTTAISTRTSTG